MKSNYKPIGEYIRLVDNRNTDLKVSTLLGLTVNKEFIPSVANIVGTNMANYKIIKKKQFACSLMQVRRDKKMPVALLQELDEAIISQAYPVFEIIDTQIILPEYMMMWFSRSEFDREACFYAVGGVRGSLEWEDFCNMKLPVPSIEKQKAIVDEYNTIANRIKLNEELNKKLEETAQAIYKQWFVDFEFPFDFAQGKPNEDGKPYKSSGGKMVWNDELRKEIPVGWETQKINQFCSIGSSRRIFYSEYKREGVPFYRGGEITAKKEGKKISTPLFISRTRYNEIAKNNEIPQSGDILLTAVGTIGTSYLVKDEEFYFKDGNIIWFRSFINEGTNLYLYEYMQSKQFKGLIDEITIGSTQNAITIATIGEKFILKPSTKLLKKYFKISSNNQKQIGLIKDEKHTLNNFRDLLLSKMAKG